MQLTQSLLQPKASPAAARPAPAAAPAVDTFDIGREHLTLDQGLRYAKDFGCLAADVKTAGTIAANLVTLPPALNKYLGPGNGLNVAGGVVSLGFDIYGAHKVFENPSASHKDKVVDLVHIALSDVLATASGSLPLFTSLHNPLALSVYVGGQAIGIGCDIYKTAYDLKQHARQVVASLPVSAEPESPSYVD